jgi:hypothetical protein
MTDENLNDGRDEVHFSGAVDLEVLDGRQIIGPDSTTLFSPQVHIDALFEWYSPFDLNAAAPHNPRTTWNNLVVLSLSSTVMERAHLERLGYREWAQLYPDGRSPHQHRFPSPAHAPTSLSTSYLAPIFPSLADETLVQRQDLNQWVDLIHWLCAVGRGDLTGYSPTYIQAFEIAALIESGHSISFGQMAAHGYFRWQDAGFADSLRRVISPPPGRVTLTMRQDIESRFGHRWAQAQGILQSEAALRLPPSLGQSNSDAVHSVGQSGAPLDVADALQPSPPMRLRMASRRMPFAVDQPTEGGEIQNAPATGSTRSGAISPTRRDDQRGEARAPVDPPLLQIRSPVLAPETSVPPQTGLSASHGASSVVSAANPSGDPAEPPGLQRPDTANIDYGDANWMLRTFGPTSLTRNETLEQFLEILQFYRDEVNPANGVESLLTWEITTCDWKIRRLKRAYGPAIELGERAAVLEALGLEIGVQENQTISRFLRLSTSVNDVERAAFRRELREFGSTPEKVEQAGIVYALPTFRAIEAITASAVFRRNAALNTLRRGREPAAQRVKLKVQIVSADDPEG